MGKSPLLANPASGLDMSALAARSSTRAASTIFLSGGRFMIRGPRRSERIHHGAHDAGACVREVAHRPLRLVDARLVAARDEQRVAGPEGDALCVGVLRRR